CYLPSNRQDLLPHHQAGPDGGGGRTFKLESEVDELALLVVVGHEVDHDPRRYPPVVPAEHEYQTIRQARRFQADVDVAKLPPDRRYLAGGKPFPCKVVAKHPRRTAWESPRAVSRLLESPPVDPPPNAAGEGGKNSALDAFEARIPCVMD